MIEAPWCSGIGCVDSGRPGLERLLSFGRQTVVCLAPVVRRWVLPSCLEQEVMP